MKKLRDLIHLTAVHRLGPMANMAPLMHRRLDSLTKTEAKQFIAWFNLKKRAARDLKKLS